MAVALVVDVVVVVLVDVVVVDDTLVNCVFLSGAGSVVVLNLWVLVDFVFLCFSVNDFLDSGCFFVAGVACTVSVTVVLL